MTFPSFFQFGGLENTKVSRHPEDVLSVLYFFIVPINLFSSGVVFLDTALAEGTVAFNLLYFVWNC